MYSAQYIPLAFFDVSDEKHEISCDRALHFLHESEKHVVANLCSVMNNDLGQAKILIIKMKNVEFMMLSQRWGGSFDNMMYYAGRYGSVEVVKMCVSLGAHDYDKAMRGASEAGNIDIAELCLPFLGKYISATYICLSAESGYIEFVKMLKKRNKCDLEIAMRSAGESGHIEIVKLCKSWGATDYEELMRAAAFGGHIAIVKLCKKWGANNLNQAMFAAAKGSHIEVVKICKRWGANNVNTTMIVAAKKGCVGIARLCKKWGASNLNRAMAVAASNGKAQIISLCKKWGATFPLQMIDLTYVLAVYVLTPQEGDKDTTCVQLSPNRDMHILGE